MIKRAFWIANSKDKLPIQLHWFYSGELLSQGYHTELRDRGYYLIQYIKWELQ